MSFVRSKMFVVAAAVFVSLVLVFTVQMQQQRQSETVSSIVHDLVAKLGQRNPVNEYKDKVDDSSALEYLQKYADLFEPSKTLPKIVNPDIPSTITQWWHAAAMIDWYINTPLRFRCQKRVWFGNWMVCQDIETQVKPPCLVYSFGISFDFSFDDAMGKLGCEVHSFDPSMKKTDHKRSQNVTFHNMGLSHEDVDDYEARKDVYVLEKQFWKMRTASSIRKMLGHENRVIDVFKMDIEGYEWDVLDQMMDSGIFRDIRQYMLEFHLFPEFPAKEKYVHLYNTYRRLREMGLKEFHNGPHPNKLDIDHFNNQGDVEFVNAEYIHRNAHT